MDGSRDLKSRSSRAFIFLEWWVSEFRFRYRKPCDFQKFPKQHNAYERITSNESTQIEACSILYITNKVIPPITSFGNFPSCGVSEILSQDRKPFNHLTGGFPGFNFLSPEIFHCFKCCFRRPWMPVLRKLPLFYRCVPEQTIAAGLGNQLLILQIPEAAEFPLGNPAISHALPEITHLPFLGKPLPFL